MHGANSVSMCSPGLIEMQSGTCTEELSTSPGPLHQPCPQQTARSGAGSQGAHHPGSAPAKTTPGQGGGNTTWTNKAFPKGDVNIEKDWGIALVVENVIF